METQFLIGLLYCRMRPESLKIVLGDRVYDAAAEESRDVDVTVLTGEELGAAAITGVEVKRERRPLDVAITEQLCAKLLDMPHLTERVIVSTSGFTGGAETKAKKRGVDLYELVDWIGPVKEALPLHTLVGDGRDLMPVIEFIYEWGQLETYAFNPLQPDRAALVATIGTDPPILDREGSQSSAYPSLRDLLCKCLDSGLAQIRQDHPLPPEIFLECREDAGHLRSFGVQLDCAITESVFVRVGEALQALTSVRAVGVVHVRYARRASTFKVLRDYVTGQTFGSAVVSAFGGEDPHILAVLLSSKDTLAQPQIFKLLPEHRNFLNRVRLK
jgi:hypothetical protein